MAKPSCSPLMGWNKTFAIGTLIIVWVFWSLRFLDIGTTDDVLSRISSVGSILSTPASDEPSLRPLVLYTYAESDNARANLNFFISNGLHGNADFVFIFNGETTAPDLLPDEPNIRIVRRNNTCFDIGAMGEVLGKDDLWKKYKRFITMNASIRGPFFPVHSPSCWTDKFLGRITEKVKLVGTTLNCLPRTHLQSMLLATDEIGMSILLDPKLALSASVEDYYGTSEDPVGFSSCFATMKKAVHAEIGITSLILSQGFKVDVMMTAPYSAPSFDEFCDSIGRPDDFLYNGHYLGTNTHPYETWKHDELGYLWALRSFGQELGKRLARDMGIWRSLKESFLTWVEDTVLSD
ncbi:hypothetical protein VMCG_04633 [Cytospora schulzeri]|uniref:Uncharacterized protein n=1 Tax=Cytospora schulzeri TaxID=448051 RepID=A0A423WRU3_9PEZI|nr:hypothetical protein VMCG_04633 [Valsa malicola]